MTHSAPAFFRLCAATLLLAGVALGAAEPEFRPDFAKPLSQRQPLIVGATSDSFPYAYVNAEGQWTGYTAEIFEAVARTMNLEHRRIVSRGQDLQRRFKDGEFDLLQTLSQTPDREEYADFTVPFLTLQGAVFVNRRNPAIRTLRDLEGKPFALIGRGSIGEKFLRDQGLHVQIRLVSSSTEALQLIENGECAASFISQLTAWSVAERLKLKDVAMLGRPPADYDIRFCFAVHKGDARLLARLNEGLIVLQRTGELDRIRDRWFGRFEPRLLTYEQVVTWGAAVFAVAFAVALAAFLRQRALRRRIARQAAELADQEALLRALYDHLPFVVCVLEGPPGKFRVRSVNRQGEAYLGRPAREAVGRPLAELPLEPEWNRHLQDLLRRSPDLAGQLREERFLSSARRRLVFTLLPLAGGPAGETRICLLVEDVTKHRALDDEIAQSRKLRAVGELVGGIAHEFNNLLTPIVLNANLIKLDRPGDRKLHADLALIADAGQRGADLTRRLLAFGRKSDGRVEAVALARVVENSFALMRLTVDRRIQWRNEVPPGLPPLHVNVTDLNQVIANLILNARDTLAEKLNFQRDGWTPFIAAEAVAEPVDRIPRSAGPARPAGLRGWQRLTVRDNGMGMSPEVRERIFEPFFTTKDVGQGTGLGLATVWHLVSAAGGYVEVESVPGQGSAFHVWLPEVPLPPGDAPTASAAPATGATALRVFLADDDDLVAQTITAVLQRAGHVVHREADGLAAWSFLRGTHASFDRVILDVNMPGLDGIAVAQRLRADLRYAGKIMIISGRLGSNDLRQITEAQVDAVLTKPFTPQELLGAVEAGQAGPRARG